MQFTRPRRVNQSVQLFRFIRQSMSKNHKRGTKMECRHGPTNTFTLGSPLGDLEVISCPFGLHSLKHMGESTDDNFLPDTNVEVKIVKQLYEDNGYTYKPALQTVKWLQHYFTGGMLDDPLPAPALCLSSHTGPFFQKVWHTLEKEVGFGRVVNYGELAEMCANPHAQQAVGQAMKKNPFSIIVPCHRVILSSGKTGNYSGGKKNNMKEWLLRHEGAIEKAC